MFDTWNLRHNAKFETKIAPDLYWVPVSSVGVCEYSERDIMNLICNSPSDKLYFHNLYEIIAYFQMKGYDDTGKNFYKNLNELKCEVHHSPDEAIRMEKGSCADIASMLNYYIAKFYSKCGYILFLREFSGGHVINYFYHNGFYYVFDLNAMLNKYRHDIPIEDGNIETYRKSKIITGCLLRCKSIRSFVEFYSKYAIFAQNAFLFFLIDEYAIPDIVFDFDKNKKKLYLDNKKMFILNDDYDKSIYEVYYI